MKKVALKTLINYLTLLVLFILYLNLASACIFSVSCESYIPTMSYMATFRTHDNGVMIALVLQSFINFLIFVSFHYSIKASVSTDDKFYLLVLELGLILLPITCGIIDESSGVDFNPMDDVHRFITFGLICFAALWTSFALAFLGKNQLDNDQEVELRVCWTIYAVELFLVSMTIAQWVLAYTVYNNVLFNHAAESIFEWSSITVAIRFPYHLSKLMNSEVAVLVNKKDS